MVHRLATQNDLDFIYGIYMDEESNKYLTYDFMNKATFQPIYTSLLESGTLYIAEDKGTPIGTYRLVPKQYRQAHSVYLGSLGIDSAYKGKGYGYPLLEGIKELARQKGWTRIELTVDLDNEVAIHLYGKAGFEIEGTIRNSYKRSTAKGFFNEYLMAVLL